jgi:putative phosphoesterase
MPDTTIGILSDTHGWLDPELPRIFEDYEAAHVVHAGDIGDEAILEELESIADVTAVRGNIDGDPLRHLPLEDVLEAHGRRIAVRHIAGSPNNPDAEALELIERESPDALVVGHSHIPVVGRVEGTLWINPGAAGRQGFHRERFAALLHVDDETGEFSMERIELGARSE